MALSPTEEAQVRQLIGVEAATLSLAANEATIISKLAATKVNLSQLPAASSVADADLFLIRQGSTDRSVSGGLVKTLVPDATDTQKGVVSLAVAANAPSTSDLEAATPAYIESMTPPVGQCFLSLSGGNLVLLPFRGYWIYIGGAFYQIPAAGVTMAPPATNNISYFIYAYMVGSTITLEASATAPAMVAATGWWIKTGDATRTFVGMGRTLSSAWNTKTALSRSWFNPQSVTCTGFLGTTAIGASASYIELNNQMRSECNVLPGETFLISASGSVFNTSANQQMDISFGFDGITPEDVTCGGQPTASLNMPLAASYPKLGLSPGYHYGCLLIRSAGGVDNWVGSATPGSRWTLNSSIGF